MAFTAAGSVTIDFSSRVWAGFPSLALTQGKTPIISFTANPQTTKVEYGYLLVIPKLRIGSILYERPALAKLFITGSPILLRLPTFNKTDNPQTWTIGLLPVEMYKGRAKPQRITIEMAIDTAIDEGAIQIP